MESRVVSTKIALTLLFALAALAISAPRLAAQPGPMLDVSPDTIRFMVDLCWDTTYYDSTPPQNLMIANIGDGDMTWSGTAGEPWVAFEPQTGGNYDSVSVWIDWPYVPQIFAAPQPGDTLIFESEITVSSSEASNSPQTVVVQLGYTCEPHGYVLAAWPNYFDLNAMVDDTLTASFDVWEAYGRSIEFSSGHFDNWLEILSPAPQTTPDSVMFRIVTVGMQPGVYYDTIVVSTPEEPSNSPVPVIVRLYIGGGGDIALAAQPDWFGYTLQEGETGGGDSLLIYETSGKTINFWTYNKSPWLYVDTMAASPLYTPRILSVNVSAAGLTPGVYTDTIEIMADEAVNSPLRVPVSLIVESGQQVTSLLTSPTYFNITLNTGQTTAEPLHIYESNGQAVEFWMAIGASWLNVTAEPHYFTPADVVVGISADSLLPGFYADTIFISPVSDSTVNPAAVPVYLNVVSDEPRLISVPAYFQFTLDAGDTLMNTGLWVYEASGDTVPFAAQTIHGSSWLRLHADSLSSWMTPDSVRFGLYTDGLAPGTYADTIILYNPLDGIEPYYATAVPVFLTVRGEPTQYTIAADPPAFHFALPTDSSCFDTLWIYELQGDTISFLYFHTAPWLAVNPFGMPPYTTPMTMPVGVTSWGLIPGTYVDTIFIGHEYDSTGQGMTAVPVTMIVGGGKYIMGDANGDLSIDISDAVEIVNYIFKDGPAPEPLEAADADCSAGVNVGDIVYLVSYIFRSGPAPGCN